MKQDTTKTIGRIGITLTVIALFAVVTTGGVAGYTPVEQSPDDIQGTVVYQGEEINLNISESDLDYSSGIVYVIEKASGDDDTDKSKLTISLDGDVVDEPIDTGELTVTDGVTYGFSNTSTGELEGQFALQESEFEAGWEDDKVSSSSSDAEVEITTQQTDNYPIAIQTESGFEYADLEALLGGSGSITTDPSDIPFEALGFDEDDTSAQEIRENDIVVVTGWENSDENLVADFSRLDQQQGMPTPGRYNFSFTEANTGETSTSSVTVGQTELDASFGKDSYRTTAGDILEVTVTPKETKAAFVQFGSPDSGFVDYWYVESQNENGNSVTVEVNTRLLGTNPSLSGEGEVYNVEGADNFVSAYHDQGTAPFDGTPTVNGVDLFGSDGPRAVGNYSYIDYLVEANLLESGDPRENMIIRPPQSGEYLLYAGGTGTIDDPSEDAVFDAQTGAANDVLAQSTVFLEQPRPSNINIYSAPPGAADSTTDVEELLTESTERRSISADNRIVIEIEATGLFGGIVAEARNDTANDIDYERLDGVVDTRVLNNYIDDMEGITFEVKGTGGSGNQNPAEVDLTSSRISTMSIVEAEEDKIYLVVDASSDEAFKNAGSPEASTFEATLEYTSNNQDEAYIFEGDGDQTNGAFSSTEEHRNYPYYAVGDASSVATQFNVNRPAISYDAVSADGNVRISADEEATISGTVNVGEDTDASLLVRSDETSGDDYFATVRNMEVDEDGDFSVNINVSEQTSGNEVIIDYRVDSEIIDSQRGVISSVPIDPTRPADDPTPVNETGPEPIEPEPINETEPEENNTSTNNTNQSQSQPTDPSGDSDDSGGILSGIPILGVGLSIAVLALIVSILILRRR